MFLGMRRLAENNIQGKNDSKDCVDMAGICHSCDMQKPQVKYISAKNRYWITLKLLDRTWN